MKRENYDRAKLIIDEIEELEKYKNLITDRKHSDVAHFNMVQHYGDCSVYETVVIDRRHTPRFLEVLQEIIKELNAVLEKL
jgi:hypothetical protein